MRARNQKLPADVRAYFVDPVQKLGQEGMQPGGQNFVNA